jgi:hypothetical protein
LGLLRLACSFSFVCLALSGSARALDSGPSAPATSSKVGIFYYPWFATPAHDGRFAHWHTALEPEAPRFASSYFPARGPYSSADALVVDAQMAEIAAAGIGTVISSWWGRGSLEDGRLPVLLGAADRRGLAVAAHLEPYPGRTVASTEADIAYLRTLGISDFYVWSSLTLPDGEWAALNARLKGVRTFANTNLPGRAAAGGFDGLYTYDVLLYRGALFPRLCSQARRLGLLCAPSVGPGYDAREATADERVRQRKDGATYDSMWRGAIRARPDVVTVTSYNEWHEGTQIEPARACFAGWECYDGAWGLEGRAAETAYLDRTAYWARRLSR